MQIISDIYKKTRHEVSKRRDAGPFGAKARVAFHDECYPTVKEKPILEYALRATDNQRVTAIQFSEHFGKNALAATPELRCPVCGERVHLTRTHDRSHRAYFVHTSGVNAACPLVNTSLPVITAFLTIYPHNVRLGNKRRGEFAAHWQYHFAEIRRHVPSFSVLRFTQSLAQADVLHVWSCPTLALEDIPYILLVLSAFIVEAPGVTHPTWLRFLFDTSILEIGDLRRPRKLAARFFRLHYRAAHNSMFPNASHLLDWAEIPMGRGFLNGDAPNVMASEAAVFADFMHPESLSQGD